MRFVPSSARTALVVTALVASGLLVAVNGVVPAGAVASASVDCDSPPTTQQQTFVPIAETFTFTVANCDRWQILDRNLNEIASGTGTTAVVPAGGGVAGFFTAPGDPSPAIQWSIRPAHPEHTPTESLRFTVDMTLGSSPSEMNVGAPNGGPSAPSEHFLDGKESCRLASVSGGKHVYTTVPLDISVAGTYTFRGVGSDPVSSYLDPTAPDNPIKDPFLALYGEFDPANPDADVIGCSDDLKQLFGYGNNDQTLVELLPGGVIMDGHQPYFVADLQPGRYTMVMMLWDEIDAASWSSGGFAPATNTFEVWGPAGGVCPAGDPSCILIDPTEPSAPSGPDLVVPAHTG